ncbi:MAG: response regulator [Phycisphaerae bacterium]
MKILLVDDSRTIRNIQKNILAQIGQTDIQEASDGVEAMALIAKGRPDLMLVDWNMPNMDGITLVRNVRQSDKTLPIIMVTTEAEKSRVIEAIKAGVNNYVVKPFTVDALRAKIEQTIGSAAGAAATT